MLRVKGAWWWWNIGYADFGFGDERMEEKLNFILEQ